VSDGLNGQDEPDKGTAGRRRLLVAAVALVAIVVVAAIVFSLSREPDGEIVVVPSPPPTPTPIPTASIPSPTLSPTPATPLRTVSIREYGAVGDGVGDDTDAVLAALDATAGTRTAIAFPAGTYAVRDITLPAGVILTGDGPERTWIQGRMEVSGGSRFTDLRMGRDGAALGFVSGASHVVFRDVEFVGGGGMASGADQGVIRFHDRRYASSILFEECVIGANSEDGNGVSMVSNGRPDANYHDIMWRRCRFGPSPRMGIEVITRVDGGAMTEGYRRIDLLDCVFEPTGSEAVSYDDDGEFSGFSTVAGCTFMGAGWNEAERFGQGIEFNGVTDMRFVHNTVYRTRDAMINHQGKPGSRTGTLFAHNVFDATTSHIAVTPSPATQVIYYNDVSGARFLDNVVKSDVGGQLAYIDGSVDNVFSRNTWTDTRGIGEGHSNIWLTDEASRNLFQDETFRTATDGPAVLIRNGSDENVFRSCTFILPGATSPAPGSAFTVAPGLTVTVSGSSFR
jgi:hypothetical protein